MFSILKIEEYIEYGIFLVKLVAKNTECLSSWGPILCILGLNHHCVKSVRIRSYSRPYFPAFGLDTGKYGPE